MQGERSSNNETKKSKAARGGTRQYHVDRIVNIEAEEEIREAIVSSECQHIPHNADSFQTVCERCSKELNYNALTDSWIVEKEGN
jgi:hypothetical protein